MKRAAAVLAVMVVQGCAQPEPVEIAMAKTAARNNAEVEASRKAFSYTPPPPKKHQKCRFNGRALIGLTRDKLKAKCGLAYPINRTTTASGTREQWVYYGHDGAMELLVYLENGVVTTVQDR